VSAITHSTPSDASFSAAGAAAWDAAHVVPPDLPGLIPAGGTTNQVLAKNSNTDYDVGWVAAGATGVVPIGGIIMWSGTIATIPATWALCDGTANSPGPDLRDQFIVGASIDNAGVAKTNLTGALTKSGGSITPTVQDHAVTQPVVADHALTQPAINAHSITQPAINDHALTQPAINAHSITQPVVSSHVLTQPVVANHTTTTAAARTSSASTAAAVTAVSAHTLSTNVAAADHTLATNVSLSTHALGTNVAVSAHVLGTNVALSAHSLSTNVAVSAHSLTTSVAVSAHTANASPQPYFALAYIQRMS
jgi:hypothetical protein